MQEPLYIGMREAAKDGFQQPIGGVLVPLETGIAHTRCLEGSSRSYRNRLEDVDNQNGLKIVRMKKDTSTTCTSTTCTAFTVYYLYCLYCLYYFWCKSPFKCQEAPKTHPQGLRHHITSMAEVNHRRFLFAIAPWSGTCS